MSYQAGTILVRDEPQDDKYDKLRVVGPSPIHTSNVAAEWGGGYQSDLLIVEPQGNDEFAGTEIAPLAVLNRDYSVEYEPEAQPTHVETVPPPRAVRKLSPEEQFRQAAKSEPEQPKRRRTRIGG